MRTLLLIAAMALPVSGLAEPDHRRNAVFSPEIEDVLQVTETQRKAIRIIYQDHRRSMQELREATQDKIDAVLSEEQRNQLRRMQPEKPLYKPGPPKPDSEEK